MTLFEIIVQICDNMHSFFSFCNCFSCCNNSSKNTLPLNDNTILLHNYMHHIRNFRDLDENMKTKISNMSNDDKMKLIIVYNEMILYVKEIICD
jgi:hypothetical protein